MFRFNGRKIFFLAGTLGRGGAERQLYYILKVLAEQGASPKVLCLTRGEFWENRIRELGIPVIWTGEKRSRVARLIKILQILSADLPDVFQSQHFYTNLYVAFPSSIRLIHNIGAIRNELTSEINSVGNIFGNLSLITPQLQAVNTRLAISTARKLGVASKRLHFLPNVVDTSTFKPSRPTRPGALHLVTVGRLVKQKRMDRIIELVSQLRDSRVNCKTTIIGDGPLKLQLQNLSAAKGLSNEQLNFAGTYSDVQKAYQEADVFVLTSDWEGTPNVILEAMACGLPVVASRVGGIPEIIKHRISGLLVPPDDPVGLYRSVMELIDNPSLRKEIGQNARLEIKENYALERLPIYLSGLYSKIIR
jgi:glycosyltransferase involved in cell wall biosynthesis